MGQMPTMVLLLLCGRQTVAWGRTLQTLGILGCPWQEEHKRRLEDEAFGQRCRWGISGSTSTTHSDNISTSPTATVCNILGPLVTMECRRVRTRWEAPIEVVRSRTMVSKTLTIAIVE